MSATRDAARYPDRRSLLSSNRRAPKGFSRDLPLALSLFPSPSLSLSLSLSLEASCFNLKSPRAADNDRTRCAKIMSSPPGRPTPAAASPGEMPAGGGVGGAIGPPTRPRLPPSPLGPAAGPSAINITLFGRRRSGPRPKASARSRLRRPTLGAELSPKIISPS